MALPKLEDCLPLGVRATGWNIIVIPEVVEERRGSIIIPDSARDKDRIVKQVGRIVSVGPAAFDLANYKGLEPKEGDAVVYAKLAGFEMELPNGMKGRFLTDKDLIAILEEEGAADGYAAAA